MLSQACVIPSVHWGGGGGLPRRVCPGGLPIVPGGGSAWRVRLGGSACSGVYIWGGGLHPGRGSASTGGWADRPQSDTMGYGQRAGGTHPTGMHPCFF